MISLNICSNKQNVVLDAMVYHAAPIQFSAFLLLFKVVTSPFIEKGTTKSRSSNNKTSHTKHTILS